MANVYGINQSKRTVEKYTGANWHLGSVRRLQYTEGPESGTEVIQFDNGTGLRFDAIPSRGLDISSASFRGIPLAYGSPAGEAHPAHYDSHGAGWLKTFFGGLLTTCGATWLGSPTTHKGEELGLHGRYSHLPARHVNTGSEWQGSRKRLWASAEVSEAHLFGPDVTIKRTLSTALSSPAITIEDTITNHGFTRTPHQWLYHINLGFPLLSEHARLWIDSLVVGRDDHAKANLHQCHHFEAPAISVPEQVFYHEVQSDRSKYAHVLLENPTLCDGEGLALWLRYRTTELPRFVQWKNMRSGMYVCGLEPANCWVEGRDAEEKAGRLQYLAAGESRSCHLEITVLTGSGIEAVKNRHFKKRKTP